MTENKELRIYQAIGVVEGILEIDDLRGSLFIGETVYPTTFSNKVRLKHQPGVSQHFKVYPNIRDGQLAFKLIYVLGTVPTVFKLNGCWEIHEDEPRFVIYRNKQVIKNKSLYTIPLSVDWENAPPTDGQYWKLEAELTGNRFAVLKADGPFDPPRKAIFCEPSAAPTTVAPQPYIPKPAPIPKAKTTEASQPATTEPIPPTAPTEAIPTSTATAVPLSPQQILAMATPAKISLTCKLNQVPKHRELPDKQVEFFLNDGTDRIFTVRMKPKMFKKLTDHGFEQWVAAISGDLGQNTETGFELLNAAVQIFQKKASADAQAAQEKAPTQKAAASAVARLEPQKADAQAGAGKRKSLLDGVRMN